MNNKSNHHFSQNVIPIDFHLFGERAYISRISRYQTWLTVIFSIVGVSQLFSNDTINFQLKHFLAISILRMDFFHFSGIDKVFCKNTFFLQSYNLIDRLVRFCYHFTMGILSLSINQLWNSSKEFEIVLKRSQWYSYWTITFPEIQFQ